MYKKILVPVDPAEPEFAQPALAAAVGMVQSAEAQLRLVAVMPVVGGYVTEFLPPDFEAETERQTTATLKAMAEKAGLPPDRFTVETRLGSIYHEVVDAATDWGADLIVLSSHRPSMATYLIGSNAARIVRHAGCSVLVVRG